MLGQNVTLRAHFTSKTPQGTVGNGSDVMVDHEFDKVGLGARRIQINLVAGRLVASVRKDVRKNLCVEVGDADSFGKTFVDETLEASPQNVHGNFRV